MVKILGLCASAGRSREPECEDVPPPKQSDCCICITSCFKEPERENVVINIPSSDQEESECCIYRVPKQLRKINKEAYTPKHVSIGPFHHRQKELSGMEIHKQRYSGYFFQRPTLKKSKEDLQKIIEDNEEKIRNCYSDNCRLKSEDFVKMILLDAIFIIELFLRKWGNKMDYISRKPWLEVGIKHDLILLENQLPFFVLEDLYMSSSCNHCEEGEQIDEHKMGLKEDESDDAPDFVKLSLNYFSDQHGIGEEVTKTPIGEEVKHFTDLLRYLFCSSIPKLFRTNQGPLYPLYCAKELDHAGLKFKAATEKRKLLEIQFHQNSYWCFNCSCLLSCLPCFKCFPFLESMQCILEVPPFQIHDDTEAIFRNLMALEQSHYPYNAYICNYVVLLDYLINTEEDVDLLIKKKVIVNMLGSNAAVATLINKLSEQITEARSCYHDIAQNLNDHYELPLNQILATLTREYFPNIFRGTATIVGLIVLGFTFWSFIKSFVHV